MEIELSGEHVLSSVFRYMEFTDEDDVRRRISGSLSDELLNSTLSPEVYDKLPADVRKQLSEGINVGRTHVDSSTSPKLIQPNKPPQASFGILGADGKPLGAASARPQLILPSGVSLPTAEAPNLTRNEAGIIVPKGIENLPPTESSAKQAWETIQSRWKGLSRTQKLSLISPNDLPKDVLAVLYKAEKLKPSDFRPRSDLPASVSQLFSRLEWVRDPFGPLEFRHKSPLSDPMLVKKDVEAFSKMVGIHKFISDPTQIEPDVRGFSFHVHISNPNADAMMLGEYINRIRMLELFEQGRNVAAINTDLGMGYSLNVRDKGLIRVIGKDRVESRIHTVGYAEEIDRLTRYLGKTAAEAELELEEIFTKKMADLLSKLSKMKPGSQQRIDTLKTALAINPIQRFPEEMSSDIARAIRGFPPDPLGDQSLGDRIAKQRYNPKYPHTVWASEIAAIQAPAGASENRLAIQHIAGLADQIARTPLLIDDLPCGKVFELIGGSR